jgi:hypothetical protein
VYICTCAEPFSHVLAKYSHVLAKYSHELAKNSHELAKYSHELAKYSHEQRYWRLYLPAKGNGYTYIGPMDSDPSYAKE